MYVLWLCPRLIWPWRYGFGKPVFLITQSSLWNSSFRDSSPSVNGSKVSYSLTQRIPSCPCLRQEDWKKILSTEYIIQPISIVHYTSVFQYIKWSTWYIGPYYVPCIHSPAAVPYSVPLNNVKQLSVLVLHHFISHHITSFYTRLFLDYGRVVIYESP